MIRVLLVDDHELVRQGIKGVLAESCEIEVIGDVSSGEEAIDFLREQPADLVLMDVNMPGIGGIEATRKVTQLYPEVKVIAVTALHNDPYPSKLLDAGAKGYVTKGCPKDELFDAIGRAIRGESYICNDVAQQMALGQMNGKKQGVASLSDREMQVMLMIVNGHSTNEIGDALFISPKTVSTYRHRLYEKLGVDTDVALTRFAIRNNLIDQS